MKSLHRFSRLVLALALSLCVSATAALAQAAPPAPPKNAVKFRKAAAPPPEGRVLRIQPGQKRVDPKVLKTAPTIGQFARQQRKASAAKRGTARGASTRFPGLAPAVRLQGGAAAPKPAGTKPPPPRP